VFDTKRFQQREEIGDGYPSVEWTDVEADDIGDEAAGGTVGGRHVSRAKHIRAWRHM